MTQDRDKQSPPSGIGQEPGATPSVDPNEPASRRTTGLLSALGEGAIGRRVRRRVLTHQTEADLAQARGQAPGLLNRLSLRLEQVYAGLVTWDREFIDTITMRLRRDRVPFASFYREIAVPLAHRLGDAWTDDRISIVDVEFAASRLSMWCDQYADADETPLAEPAAERRILLARTPGEKHTLGLDIVSRCYAHDGWQVDGGTTLETGPRLVSKLKDEHYEVVGLSVGTSLVANDCRDLVGDLRAASKNQDLKIGLGGPGVITTPEVFADAGADFMASDAFDAVQVSNRLVDIG